MSGWITIVAQLPDTPDNRAHAAFMVSIAGTPQHAEPSILAETGTPQVFVGEGWAHGRDAAAIASEYLRRGPNAAPPSCRDEL